MGRLQGLPVACQGTAAGERVGAGAVPGFKRTGGAHRGCGSFFKGEPAPRGRNGRGWKPAGGACSAVRQGRPYGLPMCFKAARRY